MRWLFCLTKVSDSAWVSSRRLWENIAVLNSSSTYRVSLFCSLRSLPLDWGEGLLNSSFSFFTTSSQVRIRNLLPCEGPWVTVELRVLHWKLDVDQPLSILRTDAQVCKSGDVCPIAQPYFKRSKKMRWINSSWIFLGITLTPKNRRTVKYNSCPNQNKIKFIISIHPLNFALVPILIPQLQVRLGSYFTLPCTLKNAAQKVYHHRNSSARCPYRSVSLNWNFVSTRVRKMVVVAEVFCLSLSSAANDNLKLYWSNA